MHLEAHPTAPPIPQAGVAQQFSHLLPLARGAWLLARRRFSVLAPLLLVTEGVRDRRALGRRLLFFLVVEAARLLSVRGGGRPSLASLVPAVSSSSDTWEGDSAVDCRRRSRTSASSRSCATKSFEAWWCVVRSGVSGAGRRPNSDEPILVLYLQGVPKTKTTPIHKPSKRAKKVLGPKDDEAPCLDNGCGMHSWP